MKVSDVNIEIIHKLLLSVPQGMQIKSIDLTNGYSLNLVAGVEEINAVEREIALDDLKSIIKQYNQAESKSRLKINTTSLIKR